MAKLCSPSIPKTIIPSGAGSGLKFSSEQIGLLRQIARESTSRFRVPRTGKSEGSQGAIALFSGSSGTGKTMAAEIVARELGFSIYRVNLNKVVSKYIGETEKNLTRVLKTAAMKKTVLLFDEADALFGKRSAVKDSHDRYANIEINFLLERLQAYPGLVILVSNGQVDLDPQTSCFLKYHLKFSLPPPPSSPLQVR